MKTTITIISLSAILACLTLLAQETPRATHFEPSHYAFERPLLN